MIKRYSITSEQIAKDLILLLSDEINPTVTEFTQAIVCLGFQDVYNKEGELIKEGLTYDIDIFWKDEPLEEFNEFEVNPITPNHTFAGHEI